MSKNFKKHHKKSINDYVNKTKFAKRELLDDKESLEIKSIISNLSQDCISNPSEQGKKLKVLFSILESKVHGKSIILRKSVLVSLCLIFKDILPTYKIVVLTEEQKQQNMKDETIKCYSEEEILLSYYHKYIGIMESVIKKMYNVASFSHIRWTETDELTLLKCACKLFVNNPNFNYSNQLLKLIVSQLNSTNPQFLKCSLSAIETAIKDDIKLDTSLKICEVIKQYAIDTKFIFRSSLLKPFLVMELEDMNINESTDKNSSKKSLLSRKQKKNLKKNKHHIKQIEQINAKESLDTKYKKNSLIIRSIFYVYFKLLKKSNLKSKLLEVILEGIGRYGRLVDCKLFPDIFSLMKKMSGNSKVSVENRLRSVFVSLNIITSGKASDILDIDPGRFTADLLSMSDNQNLSKSSVILVISCCNKLLIKRRNLVSQSDSQNLIKILIKLAWYHKTNSPVICSMILASLVKYLRLYPQIQYLFDDEEEVFTDHESEQESRPEENQKINQHESLKLLQDMCKISIYEISGVAKCIKKFFINVDGNCFLELKGTLEELTRMGPEDCIELLKEKIQKPTKRCAATAEGDQDEDSIKKQKCQ